MVEKTTTSRSESPRHRPSECLGAALLNVGELTRVWARARLAATLVLTALLGLLSAKCQRCEPAPAPAVSVVKPVPPAVPKGLLAELVVPEPEELWRATRDLAAAYVPALPLHGALAFVHAVGLPTAVAGRLDLESPVWGALSREGGGPVVVTLAVHVASGRELLAELTSGAAPAFVAGTPDSGVTPLKAKATEPAYHFAVFKNHLIASTSPEQAHQSARFLVDVVGKRPRPDAALLISARQPALKGSLVDLARAKWRAYRQQLHDSEELARQRLGRPPDFGDPGALLAALDSGVEALLAVLASSRELTFGVRFAGDDVLLGFEAVPEAVGAARDLVRGQVVGSAAPLARLPRDSVLALLSRSASAERRRTATETLARLKGVFGARLSERDQEQLAELLGQWATGRGDETSVSLLLGPAPALMVEGTLGDTAALEAALNGLPSLAKVEALAQPLAHFLGPVQSVPVTDKLAGRAVHGHSFTFGPKGQLRQLIPAGLSVFWSTTETGYRVALGGRGALVHLDNAAPTAALGDLPEVRARFERIESASFVLLARPVPLGLVPEPARSQKEPLISIGAGSRGGTGFVNIDIPKELIRSYAAMGNP